MLRALLVSMSEALSLSFHFNKTFATWSSEWLKPCIWFPSEIMNPTLFTVRYHNLIFIHLTVNFSYSWQSNLIKIIKQILPPFCLNVSKRCITSRIQPNPYSGLWGILRSGLSSHGTYSSCSLSPSHNGPSLLLDRQRIL